MGAQHCGFACCFCACLFSRASWSQHMSVLPSLLCHADTLCPPPPWPRGPPSPLASLPLAPTAAQHADLLTYRLTPSHPPNPPSSLPPSLLLAPKQLRNMQEAAAKQARGMMDAYFSRIKRLSESDKLESRLRFMLLDVIEQRARGWEQRRKKEGPKKIEVRSRLLLPPVSPRFSLIAIVVGVREGTGEGEGCRLPTVASAGTEGEGCRLPRVLCVLASLGPRP